MARELLGNIKGPQGEQGPQGPQGPQGEDGIDGVDGKDGQDVTDFTIGSKNLINYSEFNTNINSAKFSYDLEKGLIYYENFTGYLRQNVILDNKIHTFLFEDYSVNEEYNGRPVFRVIRKSDNEMIYSFNNDIGEPYLFDLSDQKSNDLYEIRFYFSYSSSHSGFIKKMMLIEGDIPKSWEMGEKDRVIYNKSFETSNYHLATIINQEISGNITTPSIVKISNLSNDSTQNTIDNKITLSQGIWLVNVNTYCTPITYDGEIRYHLYLNETEILLSQLKSSQLKNKSFSHVFRVESTAIFSLRTSKTSDDQKINFSGQSENKITLTKLGGI